MRKQATKGRGVSVSSNSSASRIKTTKSRRPRESVNHTKDKSSARRRYQMTEKQTRTWKPLDRDFKDHLHLMIDSCIKMVMGKPVFRKSEEVQDLSSDLKRKLKSSLEKVKVPKSKIKSFQRLAVTAADLKNEYENLTNQQLEVEKEIRQEERMIETLEDGVDRETLVLEIPDEELNLPKMVFSPS